jgi:hypothetical protein
MSQGFMHNKFQHNCHHHSQVNISKNWIIMKIFEARIQFDNENLLGIINVLLGMFMIIAFKKLNITKSNIPKTYIHSFKQL